MVQHKAQDVGDRPRTEDILVTEDIDFKSMLLPAPILEGLKKSGYIKPSPIQRKAIPLVRCGFDLIVQAKAGTGKTFVFTLAALEMVQPKLPHLQAVVLAPTREIALQITDVICAIGQAIPGLKTRCFIGGYPISLDENNAKGCHIAVGAPGRMHHLMEKGLLKPERVKLFVLDEADKLLEDAFFNDINEIFSRLPEGKQVLACSATYTQELINFLSRYMHHGQYVTPQQPSNSTVLLGIRQFVSILSLHVDRLAKLRLKEKRLVYLLKSISFNQCLVFSNLHSRAVSLCNMLRGQGLSAEWIAGRQDQADRVLALSHLKQQKVRVLVTTDLTARGIDVENVNLIINLDVPLDHQTYLHRMGRAGRYGSHGMVITVVFEGEELTGFQKILGEIGGTSQSVCYLPEDLKDKDLWAIGDEELEHVYGIVDSMENAPEHGEDSSSTVETSEDQTSTGEKYSPESSDDDLDGAAKKDCDSENVKEEECCSCELYLYEVELSDIEVVCGPSLFALTKRETHWRDVLPIVVQESKIPLNTPITLLGTKLIRVKNWGKNDKINIESDINTCQVVDFKTDSSDNVDYPSFEEIKATLESNTKLKVDLESNTSENVELLSFEEIRDALEKGIIGNKPEIVEEDNKKYEEIEKFLSVCEKKKLKLENILMQFDSFDVVGWMAVDETHDIIDALQSDELNVFQFDFVKCTAGKNHVKVLPVSMESVIRRNSGCDDPITVLKLGRFQLTPPFSLYSLVEKVTELNLKHVLNISKTSENVPLKEEENEQPDNVSSGINGTNKTAVNGLKDKNTIKQFNRRDEVKQRKTDTKKNKKQSKERLKENLSNISSNKNAPLDFKVEESNINLSSHCENKKPISTQDRRFRHPKDKQKGNLPKDGKMKENKNNVKRDCYRFLSKSISDKKIEMPVSKRSELTSESSDGSDSSSLISTDKIDPKLAKFYQSQSDRSSPYVDMSESLLKWQAMHDCEESDTETSDESDVTPPRRCKHSLYDSTNTQFGDTVSDTINSAYELSYTKHQGRLNKRGERRNAKGNKHREYRNIMLSKTGNDSDSVDSEATNRHSYQTACSHHHGSREDHSGYYLNQASSYPHQRERFSDRPRPGTSNQSEYFSPYEFAQNRPNAYAHVYNYNEHAYCGGRRRQKILKSKNLFAQWYVTWYSKVRQRAQQLEMAEYINVMSTP